eukprot:g2314.t1
MLFCPTCGNLLLVDTGTGAKFFCQTCPYIYSVKNKLSRNMKLDRKAVDDVLGGEAAWENVDQTDTVCPHCRHNRAYFMMVQTRSADEPMTVFYKCVKCKQRWNE